MYQIKWQAMSIGLMALGLMNCMQISESSENKRPSDRPAASSARMKAKLNVDTYEDLMFIEPSNSHAYIKMSDGAIFNSFAGDLVDLGQFGSSNGEYFLGDHNGDGKTDLYFAKPSDNTVWIKLNTTSSGAPTYGTESMIISTDYFGHLSDGGIYFAGDFSGDGYDDLLFIEPSNHSLNVKISDSGSDYIPGITTSPTGFGTLNGQYMMADFNGDGKQDIVFSNESDKTVSVRLSTGGAFSAASQIVSPTDLFGRYGSDSGKFLMGDVDGDGKDDLLFVEGGNNSVRLKKSTGTGLGSTVYTTSGFGGSVFNKHFMKDLDGDGKDELLMADGSNNTVSAKSGWLGTTSEPWNETFVVIGSDIFGHLSGGGLYL